METCQRSKIPLESLLCERCCHGRVCVPKEPSPGGLEYHTRASARSCTGARAQVEDGTEQITECEGERLLCGHIWSAGWVRGWGGGGGGGGGDDDGGRCTGLGLPDVCSALTVLSSTCSSVVCPPFLFIDSNPPSVPLCHAHSLPLFLLLAGP